MDAFFRRRDGVGGVTLDNQISDRWQQRATYALSVSHQQSTNLRIDPSYVPRFGNRAAPFSFDDFPYDSLTHLRQHYASYQADVRLGASAASEQLLTLAFDVNGERGVLTDRLAGSVVRAKRVISGGPCNINGLARAHRSPADCALSTMTASEPRSRRGCRWRTWLRRTPS
jgi:hypothetical protein